MARIVATMVVVALAATPAGALGATELTPEPAPQQPLLQNPVQEAPEPEPAPAPSSTTESRIGPGTLLIVGGAILALIGGIWFVIARDAKRATAGRLRTQTAGGETGGNPTRAGHRSRRLSSAERRRRKRGRAR
jgi:hypothetical protein